MFMGSTSKAAGMVNYIKRALEAQPGFNLLWESRKKKHILCFSVLLKRGKSSKNYFIILPWRPSRGGSEGAKSIKRKLLLGKSMSLAQCCEDELTIPCIKPGKYQRGISIAKVFTASRAFTGADASANNQPLWQCKGWKASRGCLVWWRKDPLLVCLSATKGSDL